MSIKATQALGCLLYSSIMSALTIRSLSRLGASSRMRLASAPASRSMATKVIAHCVGPDRVGILSQVTRIVTAHGGKMHDTRAVTLGGTFSVTAEIELEDDSAGLAYALQTKLPDFITCMRPESDTEVAAGVFGRLEVSNAVAMGVISQMTEHVSSRGIGFATLRTSEHIEEGSSSPVFSMNATLSSTSKVDLQWLTSEFAELGEKLNCHVEFQSLAE